MNFDERKKIGAAAGGLVLAAGVIFALIQMKDQPKSIVDNAQSNESISLPAEEAPTSQNIAQGDGANSGDAGVIVGEAQNPADGQGGDPMRLPEASTRAESSEKKKGGILDILSPFFPKETESAEGEASETGNIASDDSGVSGESGLGVSGQVSDHSGMGEDGPASEGSESSMDASTGDANVGNSSGTETGEDASTGTGMEGSENGPNESVEPTPNTDTKIAKDLDSLSDEQKQGLGNTAVTYYEHDSLPIGLDLRLVPAMAERLYVRQQSDGFLIMPRRVMNILGLTPGAVQEMADQKTPIPGAIRVWKVSAEEKRALEQKDSDALFVDASDGIYAIARETTGDDMKIRTAMGGLTPVFVQANLSTEGRIGHEPEEAKPVPFEEQQKKWDDLVASMRQNPAEVEWAWNLPLMAQDGKYIVDGKDIRSNIPEGAPTYSFAKMDINGDQTPEFLIRAQTTGAKEGSAEGYWAIFEPTPKGLKMANVIPAGNGEVLVLGDTLLFPSIQKKAESQTLSIRTAQLGSAVSEAKRLTFEKVGSMTGKELAEKYPDHKVILLDDGIYHFSMEAFDAWMDEASNLMSGAAAFDFVGESTDPITGQTKTNAMVKTDIDKVSLYLQEQYPSLPLSAERVDKATSTATFKEVDRALTAGDFDRVE